MAEMCHTYQGILFCCKTKPHDTPQQALTSCIVRGSTACSVA
jgi:hypothetical protein